MHRQLADAAATEALGRALAAPLARASRQAAVIVHLEGPLGAGKTTLARGLLSQLGHKGKVRSPTFTLLEPYELAACQVIHLDLYRLADPGELDYLGLVDLLVPGAVVLVEWAARGGDRLPQPDVRISLDYAGEGRSARCDGLTAVGRALLGSLQAQPGTAEQTS
ncbi:MAG: tRNA (adenosine(37)-N6)-threonylcarbamoyltransferase complex ATPase subunit type 1 TsaE [Gammaproteobacteria bacterium]